MDPITAEGMRCIASVIVAWIIILVVVGLITLNGHNEPGGRND